MNTMRTLWMALAAAFGLLLWQGPASAEEKPAPAPKQEEAKKEEDAAKDKGAKKKEAKKEEPKAEEKPAEKK